MSAPVSALLRSRPLRHAEVVLGPALLRGPRTVHMVKDRRRDRCYQMGAKEYFILSRLDGSRTLADISRDYEACFGRRLGESNWRQLLHVMAQRQLLAGHSAAAALPAEEPDSRRDGTGTTLHRGHRRVALGDPSRFLGMLYPRLRLLFSPYVAGPLVLAVIAMETALVVRLPGVLAEALAVSHRPALAAASVTLVLVVVGSGFFAHELAHGLTWHHFGGTATEMGYGWRGPMFYMYCKAEDVLLVRRRWPRVATAAAGVVTSLAVLLPFFAAWAVLPAGGIRDGLAVLLLFGSVQALMNYLPLPGLDGYAMLGHALNVTDLFAESYRYLGTLARRPLASPRPYPRRAQLIYLGYTALSTAVICCLVAAGLALAGGAL